VHDLGPSDWHQAELSGLAGSLGTPLYVYDFAKLSATVEALKAILRPFGGSLYFATMANDRTRILEHLSAAGLGACVNSILHLDLALRCGFASEQVQFTSTGIKPCDMADLLHRGIRTNIDSLSQLERWFSAGAASAGLRVNACSLVRSGTGDRIGVERSEVKVALELAERCGGRIAGVHVYVGTNFQTPEEMMPTLRAFFALAAEVPELEYVNIGGGIGVDYSGEGSGFDLQAYGVMLQELVADLRAGLGRSIDVIVEPGRSLTAPCGAFLAEIIDIKRLNGVRYVAVDASVALFPRPLHHPDDFHRVMFPGHDPRPPGAERETVLIVGRTTFSKDILGRAEMPASVAVGDIIMIENAGAYSQSMASCFLGQTPPAEAYLERPETMAVAAE
jgi:diaminopimelate decarboxylase